MFSCPRIAGIPLVGIIRLTWYVWGSCLWNAESVNEWKVKRKTTVIIQWDGQVLLKGIVNSESADRSLLCLRRIVVRQKRDFSCQFCPLGEDICSIAGKQKETRVPQHCKNWRSTAVTRWSTWLTACSWLAVSHHKRQHVYSLVHLGPVHTYPGIFESVTFSFRIRKYPRPHVFGFVEDLLLFPLCSANSKMSG